MNIFSTPREIYDRACTEFGLEDEHTIAIAGICEIYEAGGAKCWDAAMVCRAIYLKGLGALQAVED